MDEFKELEIPVPKRKYKVTRKAILQRQTNALKEGYSSTILAKLSSCHNCSFKGYCQQYQSDPNWTEDDKIKGCKEIRQAFISVLHELTANPEAFIAKDIANISIELDLQTIKDGKLDEGVSKSRIQLYKIKDRLMENLLKYRGMKAKYTLSTKHTVKVEHMNKEEVFEVKK